MIGHYNNVEAGEDKKEAVSKINFGKLATKSPRRKALTFNFIFLCVFAP